MATKSSKPLDHLTKEEHEEAEKLLKELPIKTVIIQAWSIYFIWNGAN